MDLATWAPTLVSVATGIFIAGAIYGKQKDHTKKLEDHEEKIDHLGVRLNESEIEIAKLQSWRDGYNAATAQRNNN